MLLECIEDHLDIHEGFIDAEHIWRLDSSPLAIWAVTAIRPRVRMSIGWLAPLIPLTRPTASGGAVIKNSLEGLPSEMS